MSTSAPVSLTIFLMFLPLGPITRPIWSTSICSISSIGAYWLIVSRGAGITSSICSITVT